MTDTKYDDLLDSLQLVEWYQDIRINKKTIIDGMRDCDKRYDYIKQSIVDPNRPFTVLDMGANFGYYSIRLLEDFPSAFCVLIQPYEEADVLKKIIELNHHIKDRVIVLNTECNKENIGRLSKCEHFDVILCLNILHHCQAPMDIYQSIKQMTQHLIIETPPIDDVNSCGQQRLAPIYNIVNRECHKKSDEKFQRQTLASAYSHFYEFKFESNGVKKIPFYEFSGHLNDIRYVHTFDGNLRHFQKINADDIIEYPHIHGINLSSFFALNGIYPTKKDLLERATTEHIKLVDPPSSSPINLPHWCFILNENLNAVNRYGNVPEFIETDSDSPHTMIQEIANHFS